MPYTYNETFEPTQISGLTDIVSIDSGSSSYSVALRSDGSIWVLDGSVRGDGLRSNLNVLIENPDLFGFIDIVYSSNVWAALKEDGTVWTWGSYNDDWFYPLGRSTDSPTIPGMVSELSNVKKVVSSRLGSFSGVLKEDGTVWMWGRNTFDQLGIGTTSFARRPTQVRNLIV